MLRFKPCVDVGRQANTSPQSDSRTAAYWWTRRLRRKGFHSTGCSTSNPDGGRALFRFASPSHLRVSSLRATIADAGLAARRQCGTRVQVSAHWLTSAKPSEVAESLFSAGTLDPAGGHGNGWPTGPRAGRRDGRPDSRVLPCGLYWSRAAHALGRAAEIARARWHWPAAPE